MASIPGKGMAVVRDGERFEVGEGESPPELDDDLELDDAEAASVSGVVHDALGGAVGGAEVRIVSTGPAGGGPGVTASIVVLADDLGRFAADVPAGLVRVVAMAEGYASADISRIAPAEGIKISLAPASFIAGRVVDGDSGQPIAGATVRALGEWGPAQETVSDASGAFQLDALKPGNYGVRAFASGWIGQAMEQVALDLSSNAQDVLVPMQKAVRVEGILSAAGEPCTEGLVALGPFPGGEASVPREITRTNPEGRVVFPALPPGTYHVEISCPAYGNQFPDPLVLDNQDRLDLVWEMQALAEAVVVARDTRGEPVAGTYLSIRPPGQTESNGPDPSRFRSGRTDADGRMYLKGMAPGVYSIEGPQLVEAAQAELAVGQHQEVEVRANAVGEIVVSVRTAQGQSLHGVTVAADQADGRPGAFGRAVGGGRYRIGPIDAGSYTVSVRDAVNPRVDHPQVVDVSAGDVTEVEVEYGGYDGVISGVVLDGQGEPLADMWVSAVSLSQGQDNYARAQQAMALREGTRPFTDASGRFELKGLNPGGRYVVVAERPSGGGTSFEGAQPGQVVELTIADPAGSTGDRSDESTVARTGAPSARSAR